MVSFGFGLALLVAGIFTVKDLGLINGYTEPKDIGSMGNPTGLTLTFMICIGWGYSKVFQEYANAIQQRYPEISIKGINYPAPTANQYIAMVANAAKWVGLAVVVGGEKVQLWQNLNMPPPNIYTWSQEHKIMACMSLWFIGNTVEGALLQTGAFEIDLNGMPLWSKLKSGRIPQGDEMFDILNNQMKLSGGIPARDFNSKQNIEMKNRYEANQDKENNFGDRYAEKTSEEETDAFQEFDAKEEIIKDEF